MSANKDFPSVTDENFEKQVLNSSKLTVVDFGAEWCGPCKVLGPVIEEIAQELGDQATVYKMDVDGNPSTPSKYHIRGIPTVILFKDGKVVDQLVGALPKDVILGAIQKQL